MTSGEEQPRVVIRDKRRIDPISGEVRAPAGEQPSGARPGPTVAGEQMSEHETPVDEQPQAQEQELRLSVSDREILQKKDFAQMSAAEIAEVTRAIANMRPDLYAAILGGDDHAAGGVDRIHQRALLAATAVARIPLACRGGGGDPPEGDDVADRDATHTQHPRYALRRPAGRPTTGTFRRFVLIFRRP